MSSRMRPQPSCPVCGGTLDAASAGGTCAVCSARARATQDPGSRTQRIPAVRGAPDLGDMPEGMSLALESTSGPVLGRIFQLSRRLVVIGREEGEVVVADPMISRRHASLEVHDLDTVILRDLSSTNGTYHNGQLIAFCRVQDGDEIRLGSTTFTVAIDRLG